MEEERAKRLEDHNKMLQAQQKLLSFYNPVNKDIETIKELQDNYSEMLIVSDPYFKDIKFNDAHPSKICHQTIANGIIKSITIMTIIIIIITKKLLILVIIIIIILMIIIIIIIKIKLISIIKK